MAGSYVLFNFVITDLARNNITTITDDNFRGQDGLHELDLSSNKIHRMASGVFFHLKVCQKHKIALNSPLHQARNNVAEEFFQFRYLVLKLSNEQTLE